MFHLSFYTQGLGKTVEVVVLLLAHKDAPNQRGTAITLDSEGTEGAEIRKVKGPTLIVTPAAILQQVCLGVTDSS